MVTTFAIRRRAAKPRARLWLVLVSVFVAFPSLAQNELRIDEQLSFDRPESWAMKYFASLNLFTGLGVPRPSTPGSIDLGFELDWVPGLSEAERTVGFDGTKTEDINRTDFFGRPRLEVGLPAKLTLAVSWVPPIEIYGVKPNLWSLALGRPVAKTERWRFGLRLFGQAGTLEGDFTCPRAEAEAGDDPELNPFFCDAPSSDEMEIRSGSVEFSGAYKVGDGKGFEPYFGLAGNWLDLEFQVDARYNNIIDHTRLLTDGSTYYATLGFQYLGWKRTKAGVEVFYTLLDVVRPPSTSSNGESLFNVRSFVSVSLK